MMRATMSFGPPAENPTTKRIGRLGNFSWANAGPTAQAKASNNKARLRATRITLSMG
jgi:hypothetical protein